jgi:GT2 family glycosyltransferase
VDVTIAIPAFNDDPGLFARVLDAVEAGAPEVPVVVVDMSTDERVAEVCRDREQVRYCAFPNSGGVSHSRNRSVELAETRYVVFLDSDAIPQPGWLQPLRARLEEDRVAVVGSRVLAEFGARPPRLFSTTTASDWLSLFELGDEPREVPRIMGTSYAIDRTRVPDPPFDESLGRRPGWPLAREENALCEAARARGGLVLYEPASVVRHHIPPERLTWRWMWRRAHTAGRETRAAGRDEPLPRPPLTLMDRVFRMGVALPFLAGALSRPRERDAAALHPR